MDIVDQFSVILSAVPFISSSNKEKALEALRGFSTNYFPPPVLTPGTVIALYSKHRKRFVKVKTSTKDLGATGKTSLSALRTDWLNEYFTAAGLLLRNINQGATVQTPCCFFIYPYYGNKIRFPKSNPGGGCRRGRDRASQLQVQPFREDEEQDEARPCLKMLFGFYLVRAQITDHKNCTLYQGILRASEEHGHEQC